MPMRLTPLSFFSLALALVLPASAAMAAEDAAATASGAVYVVQHIDIDPKAVQKALPVLLTYATAASHDPAIASIELLQQSDGSNHFTVVEAFHSAHAMQGFVAQPYVKAMRTQIQPMLGSPFDERVHHRLVLQSVR